MGELISKFLRHVLPGVIRPLHALWNEVIGFLFMVIRGGRGVLVDSPSYAFEGDLKGLVRNRDPRLGGLVMGYFGVSSFLRARKISRS